MTVSAEREMFLFVRGVLNSYSQVFFSKNKVFAAILLAVTFFDWLAGLSGLIAVITSNSLALAVGYNREKVFHGWYGFNSLLVGLGLGIYYQPGFAFFFLLIFAAIFTLFLTIWLENFFGKYGLPYLAWPFILGIWMVSLAARQFTALDVSMRNLYVINEMYDYGGTFLVDVYHWINNLPVHESILLYFQSLGAIFFQYHLLAGVLIAIGLLIYSRIAFLVSLVGFFTAYFYYHFIGANLGELSYSYIGFNYILTSIAIGGFFLIPSRHSFLWVVLLTPIISIIITSTSTFFSNLHLSIYSLAFNIIVVLFVYVMKFRERNFTRPELVVVQHYSPEKNLYNQHNYRSRFDVRGQQMPIHLPFWGSWIVTQAHDGEHTHQDQWKHAWDFEIVGADGKKYQRNGVRPEDYLCYNQSVIVPADGIVEEIHDGIDDNEIGNINLEKNWGNTIVIRHAENLYSKISHLKKGSFSVKKGDEVKRGALLAKVGNSGRSPVPHIHFQIQNDPSIGSKTIDYPIAEFILETDEGYELRTDDRPEKDQVITGITKNESLHKAFGFIPGQVIKFNYLEDDEKQTVEWAVKTDIYNNTFLECTQTGARAWFKNDGRLFYFTQFTGEKKSLLFYFYLGAYKVALGFYKDMVVHDKYPLAILQNSFRRFWQDFIAPFYIFMKAGYTLRYVKMEDELSASSILLRSETHLQFSGSSSEDMKFEIFLDDDRIKRFEVRSDKKHIKAEEVKT